MTSKRGDFDATHFKTNWPSIYVSALVAFIGSVHQNSVMIWPYLQLMDSSATEIFYGMLRSSSGLGIFVSGLIAGWWSDRVTNIRDAMVVGKLLAVVSCSCYVCIELIYPNSFWVRALFVFFQVFLGISTGAANMYRTHVAHASTEAERAKAIGLVSLAPSLGLLAGPAVNLFSAAFPFPGIPLLFGLHFNLFTAPILIAIVISTFSVYMLFFHFDSKMHYMHQENSTESSKNSKTNASFDRIAVGVCLLTRCMISLCIVNATSVCPPYGQMAFQWDAAKTVKMFSYIMAALGLLSIVWTLCYVFFNVRKRISETNAIIGSLCLIFGCYLITFPWPYIGRTIPYQATNLTTADFNGTFNLTQLSNSSKSFVSDDAEFTEMPPGCPARFEWCGKTPLVNEPLFIGSYVMVMAVAVPISQINLDILYSLILGKVHQGTMQGMFVACTYLPDIIFPILMTRFYESHGPMPIWIAMLACLGLTIILWIVCRTRMALRNY